MGHTSREELDALIAAGLAEYDDAVRARWDTIRIEPERWECGPHGARYGGVWAVAIDGTRVLWLDEEEGGFTWTPFSTRGVLDPHPTQDMSFVWILEQFAEEIGATARARIPEGAVPSDLVGPGTVLFRQSMYWDLATTSGVKFRVHFRERIESRWDGPAYGCIDLVERHPVLARYHEPSCSLYFTGEPPDAVMLAACIDRAIRDDSDTWRGLYDYAGTIEKVGQHLAGRFGKLMDAPESACRVAAVLEAGGVQCTILGSVGPDSGYRALLLGRSFVIARGFVFERRGP